MNRMMAGQVRFCRGPAPPRVRVVYTGLDCIDVVWCSTGATSYNLYVHPFPQPVNTIRTDCRFYIHNIDHTIDYYRVSVSSLENGFPGPLSPEILFRVVPSVEQSNQFFVVKTDRGKHCMYWGYCGIGTKYKVKIGEQTVYSGENNSFEIPQTYIESGYRARLFSVNDIGIPGLAGIATFQPGEEVSTITPLTIVP